MSSGIFSALHGAVHGLFTVADKEWWIIVAAIGVKFGPRIARSYLAGRHQ